MSSQAELTCSKSTMERNLFKVNNKSTRTFINTDFSVMQGDSS